MATTAILLHRALLQLVKQSRIISNTFTTSRVTTQAAIKKYPMDPDTNRAYVERLRTESRRLAPDLNAKGNYKGNSGKVAVIGGSVEYTGAPYFAAISALKVGADLVHVFCTKDAAAPIKSYSPELIVHPLLHANGFDAIADWLPRMSVVLIGCGLGRDMEVLNVVERILAKVKELKKPLILDADALYLITKKPNLLVGFESTVLLTPNRAEIARLVGANNPVAVTDEDVMRMIRFNKWKECLTVLVKGPTDLLYTHDFKVTLVDLGGSGRRCGGQGDLLGGSLACFLLWSLERVQEQSPLVAAYAACKLVRECNRRAFLIKGRSMTTTDMIEYIHEVFEAHFEFDPTARVR